MSRAYWRALHWAFKRRLIPLRLMFRLCELCDAFRPDDPRTLHQETFVEQRYGPLLVTEPPEGWDGRRPDGPTITD